jgi:hypothetical protein
VAEGDAAIHATRPLFLQLLGAEVQMELVPVPDALHGGAIQRQFPQILYESGWFSQGQPSVKLTSSILSILSADCAGSIMI